MNKKLLLSALLFAPLATMCFEAQAMKMAKQMAQLTRNFAKSSINNPEILNANLKLSFDYNNPEFFEQNIRKAYNNIIPERKCTKEEWEEKYPEIITSLKNGDGTCFAHAIANENKNVISFTFGKFIDKKHAYIDYAGSVPAFRRKNLVWQLILSIFDHYPVDKVSLVAVSKSGNDFCIKLGFTLTAQTDAESFYQGPTYSYEITRSKAEQIEKERARKKEKIGEI